jgi:N-acetylglucosamine-6-phosphate deacetylase
MAALGMPPGQYSLGEHEVTSDGRAARLPDGRLAGSILSLDEAVRNLISFTGCKLEEAVATVTTTPARLLNVTAAIAPGLPADLVMLTSELEVAATFARGTMLTGPR